MSTTKPAVDTSAVNLSGSGQQRRRSSVASVSTNATRLKTRRNSMADIQKAQSEALPLTNKRAHPGEAFLAWMKSRPLARSKDPSEPEKVSLLSLLGFSTGWERFYMVVGLLCAGVSGLGLPAWLVLLAKSLDKFSNLASLINIIGGEGLQNRLQEELTNLVIAFVIVGCIVLVTGALYVALWTYTGEQQALRIKDKYVTSALKQDAAWFDLNNRDEMPTTIATAMIHVNGAIGRSMADVFANSVSAAGCLAVALVLNAPLALIMLCIVPVVGIVILILSCFIRKTGQEAADEFSKAGALSSEVISGMKTVASLCAQPWALKNYETHCRESQRLSIRSGFLGSVVSGVTGMLFYVTYTIAFFIGTEQVAENAGLVQFIRCFFDNDPSCSITGASVMCAIYGVILCATFFGLMQPGIQAINSGRQSAVHVFSTIHRTPPIDPSSEEGLRLDTFKGGLELKDVFFTYPSRPNNPIFYDFNLKIKPGQSMALVGPSGSGKSTIARLLLRFYDPQQGHVLVDSTQLDQVNVKWWRSQVGYVPQEPTLFPGTIKYNIACGKEGATDNEVYAAAKAACAHDFIKDFPDGYDTYYSGASIQLSGGQMQRIAIARAIIRNPSVLLLDEATSALDSNSEKQVQGALANIRKTKQFTTVTVAHRLQTIMDSDQIAVISGGKIAEIGTHKELFDKNGIYTNLCESQGITAESQVEEDEEAVENGPKAQDPTASATSVKQDEEAPNGPDDDETDEREEEELAPLSRLWQYSKPEVFYILEGLIGAMIVGALSPSEAILTAQIVANYYTVDSDGLADANRKWTLGFFAFAGAALIGNLMVGNGLSVSGYRLARRMRVMTFSAIVRRPMGWFDFPEHSTGELTTRLATDAELVSNITGYQLGFKVRTISSLLTGVIIALVYSWQVGLIAIACIPFIMGAAVVQALCLSKRWVNEDDGLSPATILEQALRGITAVQAFGLESDVAEDYSKSLEPERDGKVKLGYIAGLVYGFSQFSIFVSFAVVFYVGSLLLTNTKINFVEFFTSVLAVMFGAVGAAQVNADFKARQDGQAAAARIFDIVDEPLDSTDPFSDKGEKPSSVDGSINFETVYFHYPTRPNNPIYYKSEEKDGFNLSIAAKESVAFVGKSGCGKSTAEQLVLRFYSASSGDVRIDGHIVEDLNIMWLREQIGYVGQQPVLFSGTVRENILLGKPDATDDEITKSAKAANAHEFIMGMNDGYNTDIGSGGSLLSGGQKQRVAIARAIVKNPKILVLDEATSALDNESERVVQAALDQLQETQPRTTLTVAHRLFTVKKCNRIAVLDGGGVSELGSHDELLEQKGLYYRLWMQQGGAPEEEEEIKGTDREGTQSG